MHRFSLLDAVGSVLIRSCDPCLSGLRIFDVDLALPPYVALSIFQDSRYFHSRPHVVFQDSVFGVVYLSGFRIFEGSCVLRYYL